jgi:uncharacterized protein YhbP (UPF0306 family)
MEVSEDRMEQAELIREFLLTQSTLVLSTVTESGEPHSAPVFYLLGKSLDLYWLSSSSSSDHSLHLANHPNVSAAVFRSTEDWSEIAGVQMRGTVHRVAGASRQPILNAYRERFHLGREFSIALLRSKLYCLRPIWIRYIDNSKHFGYKFEIDLSTTSAQLEPPHLQR